MYSTARRFSSLFLDASSIYKSIFRNDEHSRAHDGGIRDGVWMSLKAFSDLVR